jgi:hypothetical protein
MAPSLPILTSEERLQCSFSFLDHALTQTRSSTHTSRLSRSHYIDKTRSHLLKHFCHSLSLSSSPSTPYPLHHTSLTVPIVPDPIHPTATAASPTMTNMVTDNTLDPDGFPARHFPRLELSMRQMQILTPILSFLLVILILLLWSCYLARRRQYHERRRLQRLVLLTSQHQQQTYQQQRQRAQVQLQPVIIRIEAPTQEAETLVTRPLPAAVSKVNLWEGINSARSRWTRDEERRGERGLEGRVQMRGGRVWSDVEERGLPPRYESLDGYTFG